MSLKNLFIKKHTKLANFYKKNTWIREESLADEIFTKACIYKIQDSITGFETSFDIYCRWYVNTDLHWRRFFFQLADVYTTYVLQKNIYQFDISLTVVGSTLLKQQHKNTKTSPITSLIALCINSLLQKIDLSATAVDNISWTKKIFFFSVTQIKPVLAGLNNPYFQLFILSTEFREK